MRTINVKEDTFDKVEELRSKNQTRDDIIQMLVNFFLNEAKKADLLDKDIREQLEKVLPKDTEK